MQPSEVPSVSFEREYWRTVKSKFILKVNSLWINIEAQNVASEVLSKHTENLNKKGNDFLIIVVLQL